MKKKLLIILTGAALIILAAGTLFSVNNSASETTDGGYVIHLDPATGKTAAASPATVPVSLDRKTREALNTSFEGLEVVPNPAKAGGVMVNLQGRFQHAYVAVIDDQGKLKVSCISNIPAKKQTGAKSSDDQGGE